MDWPFQTWSWSRITRVTALGCGGLLASLFLAYLVALYTLDPVRIDLFYDSERLIGLLKQEGRGQLPENMQAALDEARRRSFARTCPQPHEIWWAWFAGLGLLVGVFLTVWAAVLLWRLARFLFFVAFRV